MLRDGPVCGTSVSGLPIGGGSLDAAFSSPVCGVTGVTGVWGMTF